MSLLLEIGGAEQLQVKDEDGMLPMNLAAQWSSSVDVVRLLLGRGSSRHANVDIRSGQSIVLAAVKESKEAIAEVLIEAGVPYARCQ